MKTCRMCNIEKEEIEFQKTKNKCKLCIAALRKPYIKQNSKMLSEKNKEYRNNNKYDIKIKKWIKRVFNLVKLSDTQLDFYKKLYEKFIMDKKINRELRKSISRSIRAQLKYNNFIKNNSISKFLPYTIKELKTHIELLFEDWMTWENRGIYNKSAWDDNDKSTWTWQLDHEKPHSDFQYTDMECQEFKDCWSLSNLRPYSAKQNVIDGARRIRHKNITENILSYI